MVETPEIKSKNIFTQFRRKSVVNLLRTWREMAGTARHVFTSEIRPHVPKEDRPHLHKQMAECLDNKGGELSARARTVELGETYLSLNDAGRVQFLRMLAADFDIDAAQLAQAIDAFKRAGSPAEQYNQVNVLREILVTPRSKILKQFSALPNGFKFLVDMRSDLMSILEKDKDPQLKGLEYDLKAILSSWFDIGLLDLVEITWSSPAALLEKLMVYEAVHKIRSWDDLKNRLDADRRVYAFLHNKMPIEPLIFVQVALVQGMSDNIQSLLDETSPVQNLQKADTAIFYSISNAQKGLAGISFGNFLIKRVVDMLSRELKQIKTFATLSPIPGFRAWLDPLLAKGDETILTPVEIKEIKQLAGSKQPASQALKELLAGEWHKDTRLTEGLQPILMRLCGHYLQREKKGNRALDPVAHFHLFNGARLERINWLADTSPKGFKQSAGMMVNYYYKLSDIDENHEAYADSGKVTAAKQVRSLLE